MLRFEDFGITPGKITALLVCGAVSLILVAAVLILLYCLFGIGLARIAKKRGEEKEWYAYLPLLRYYTLGKMTMGSERLKKVFACLLPSLLIGKFVLSVLSAVLLMRGAVSLLFAAENMSGSAIDLTSLVTFPIAYYIAVLIFTLIVSFAAKIVSAICYYGAFSDKGNTTAVIFTILTFIYCPLGSIFLYVVSKDGKAKTAEETGE